MLCRVSDEGDLLDSNGEELTSISDVVDDIAGISTLNEKAKLITIQAYPGIIFYLFITTRLRICGEVMFSVMSGCPHARVHRA